MRTHRLVLALIVAATVSAGCGYDPVGGDSPIPHNVTLTTPSTTTAPVTEAAEETPMAPDWTSLGFTDDEAASISVYVSMAQGLVSRGQIPEDRVNSEFITSDMLSNYGIRVEWYQAEAIVKEIQRGEE